MHEKFTELGLIEPESLKNLLDKDHANLVILDASFALPASGINTVEEFKKQRIQNARFFDIEAINDKNSDLPNMLPSPPEFSRAASKLGISNDSFIVVYGQDGITMGAARCWWMFRAMGHSNIAVLNGGLPAWLKNGYKTISGEPSLKPRHCEYHAKPQNLVCDMQDVRACYASERSLIFDARPLKRFSGKQQEPRSDLLSGHIPHSINIPAGSLINPDTQKLKNIDELKAIFSPHTLSDTDDIIATCGSGVTACVILLALHRLEIKNVRVYDGSWSEWAQPQLKNPISQ